MIETLYLSRVDIELLGNQSVHRLVIETSCTRQENIRHACLNQSVHRLVIETTKSPALSVLSSVTNLYTAWWLKRAGYFVKFDRASNQSVHRLVIETLRTPRWGSAVRITNLYTAWWLKQAAKTGTTAAKNVTNLYTAWWLKPLSTITPAPTPT